MAETVFYNSNKLVGIGSVGIGTQNPSCLLEFNASAGINKVISLYSGTAADPLTAIDFNGFGATTTTLRYQSATSSGGGHTWYCGATEAMRIGVSAGILKVGVGTTNLQNRFGVAGNVGIGATYVDTAAPTNGLIVQGNVGIGTATPIKPLQVWGGVIFGASADSRATTMTVNAPGSTVTYSANADIGDGARIMCLQCPDLSSTTANLVSFSLQVAPTGSGGTQRTCIDLKGFRVASQAYGGFCVTSPFDSGGSYDLLYADRTQVYFQQSLRNGTLAGTGNRALYADPSGYLTTTASDARLKTDIASMSYGLDVVNKFRPISFNWISGDSRGPQREIGFIAQEVQELVPEVVNPSSDGILSLDYSKLTAVLAKAVQELSAKNTNLETQLETAQNDIDLLESRLAAIEALISTDTSADVVPNTTGTRVEALLSQV